MAILKLGMEIMFQMMMDLDKLSFILKFVNIWRSTFGQNVKTDRQHKNVPSATKQKIKNKIKKKQEKQ